MKVAWKNADGVTPEQAQTGKEPSLIGFQEIRCHVIFNVKMNFTRKARTRIDYLLKRGFTQ